MSKIPLIDVKGEFAPLVDELKTRFAEVLESGQFILGPNVKAFEAEAADHLGVADTIGCGNGTDAITLVLSALGIGPGDEVICPAFTFYATAEPIALLGATPAFGALGLLRLRTVVKMVALVCWIMNSGMFSKIWPK